ncbi:hypothetical protein AAVH_21126, partial [Aphelenchoides avenae]
NSEAQRIHDIIAAAEAAESPPNAEALKQLEELIEHYLSAWDASPGIAHNVQKVLTTSLYALPQKDGYHDATRNVLGKKALIAGHFDQDDVGRTDSYRFAPLVPIVDDNLP